MTEQTHNTTVEEVRAKLTSFQKELIQATWKHFRRKGDWQILRALYRDHGGKAKVRAAILEIGGSIGREETGPRRWSRYTLTLLGTMMTEEGMLLQALIMRLFQFQRELYKKDPWREDAKSEEIQAALRLDKEETSLLGQLLWLARFGGGRNDQDGTWSVSAMEEAAEFPQSGDLATETDRWLCRYYNPDATVFQDQRPTQYFPSSLSEAPATIELSPPHLPEIAVSLERLRAKYPDPKKLGFLIMRFAASKPYKRIVKVIKETAKKYDLVVVRADEDQFHADLWGNVRTLLHGCGYGITVYERIESNEPNANVGLEVGYLMAMNKPVLLLKDKTVSALQADLTGKLYKTFDPHDPETTIPDQLTQWLQDNGIIVH